MNVFRVIRLADIFSLLNGLFGFGAILAASLGNMGFSVLLVILSAVADGFDGFLARRTKASELGAGLDSLADLISFGVAPAVLVIKTFDMSAPILAASMIYLTCGILRLARFNISADNDRSFEGIPITASGLTVAASNLSKNSSDLTLILMIVLAALMVCSIPYPKIRDIKALIAFGLVLLVAAIPIVFGRDISLSGTLILTVMAAYVASPVVMSCLQRER
jgi:archaetidylserine synthase